MHTSTDYRRYLLSVLLISLGLLVLPAAFVFAIDPLQVFHKHRLTEVRFLPQERFQNVGLINSYLADEGVRTLILGTSMSQNFRPAKVEPVLDWGKTLRLSLSGGTPRELYLTLAHALKQGGVRHVLWEIHAPYTGLNTQLMHTQNLFPAYFYNDSLLDDARYLFNSDAIELAQNVIKGEYARDADHFSYWMTGAVKRGAFEKFNAPESRRELAQKLAARRDKNDRYEGALVPGDFPNIDVNVFELIKAYPEVDFVLFVPPLSTLNYALMKPPAFLRALAMRRYILQQAEALPNVRLYAFDDVAWIVADLKNYKDLGHYGVDINEYMIRAIKADKHRLTLANIDAYERAFTDLVRTYAIDAP